MFANKLAHVFHTIPTKTLVSGAKGIHYSMPIMETTLNKSREILYKKFEEKKISASPKLKAFLDNPRYNITDEEIAQMQKEGLTQDQIKRVVIQFYNHNVMNLEDDGSGMPPMPRQMMFEMVRDRVKRDMEMKFYELSSPAP
ncbi:MAG: hypothetical protein K0S29_920 [Gammaproteobacteria bacterium]|nr:hypothetical protein [Gammaproteobacteria bacterium]